jgi:mannose-6-phosphate isomerase-like protein (cupin superfamily)
VLTADPGEPLDTLHDETDSKQEEVYIVVTGRAIVTLDGVEHDVGPGTIVSAAPSVTRAIRASEADTRIVCIGALAGTGEEGFGAFVVPA